MSSEQLGIYIHTPYCIQRCLYCDFATYERSQIFPPQEYIQLLLEEMRQKSKFFTPRGVDSIYFGGGTPSLLEPELLNQVLVALKELGFFPLDTAEITIEINPATISKEKLGAYKAMGINRYSVGAQTFKDSLLKKIGREHEAQQTFETLSLLRESVENFNFDILFALPNQSLKDLEADLDLTLQQNAQHISPYCLTIPKAHILSAGRPPEDEQVEMFDLIKRRLLENGFQQYEISNFSKPGRESKHNLLYWTDQEYWGLGLSAHSYSKGTAWGTRFWNVTNIHDYKKQVLEREGSQFRILELPENQFEALAPHQSLSDFCHTSLRLMSGLSEAAIRSKFGERYETAVHPRLEKLHQRGFLSHQDSFWRLTERGLLLSNLVFEELTFLG